jgi:RNA polymerase subunit RPABC4/transcription elongation factor Spt4
VNNTSSTTPVPAQEGRETQTVSTQVYKTCDVCRRSFPKGDEKHYTCPACSSKDYSHLVGKAVRTPFEPSGLVKVLEIEGPYDGKRTAFIVYAEDHPKGYRQGDIGRYFAHELRPIQEQP